MLFQPDGTHLALLDNLPTPLQPVTRDLVLAGAGGIMPRRATVTGVAIPVGLALPTLLTPGKANTPPSPAGGPASDWPWRAWPSNASTRP